MCDVLFVIPSFKKSIQDECLGTLLLATILKEKGINVDIYRLHEASSDNGFEYFLNQSVNNILMKNPRIISFYCRCDCYLANIQIAKAIKESNPEIQIVFGGPQADASSYATMKEIPWVDFCCSGEGETTVYPLFHALLNGYDYTGIDGLSYRDSYNNIIENNKAELVQNLDDLPVVDYSFIDDELFKNAIEDDIPFPIEVGRGCPFNCAYCSTSLFWKRRFRLKSIERLIQEVEYVNKHYHITRFSFKHDLFTADKKRTLEFCRMLKEKQLNIRWGCSSRADTLDEETIKYMHDSGLVSIFIGIESGSERMQKLIHKNLKLNEVKKVVETLIDLNIRTTVSFIYGFPDETEEDVELTLQFAKKLFSYGARNIQYHLCTILPGTEYYERYSKDLVFASMQSDIVGDFGTKEYYDFICNHKQVFPFYYEFESSLREKYKYLGECAYICFMYHELLNQLIPRIFDNTKIIDIYSDILMHNREFFEGEPTHSDCTNNRFELFKRTLSAHLSGENLTKTELLMDFLKEYHSWLDNENSISEIHTYPIDIKAYLEKKTIDKIELTDVIAYFNKTGDNKTVSVIKTNKLK